ncbi:TRAP transporter large permease subunit [Sphaerochaeta associata]|uniref:TRAP transporter large permease subunit n=1 Tax=Sphaerochaeta associata TaxID=1129264 RepID=A0ABY4D9T3_9SPIR|nr:TRAP transporter large permease subunit [Sphaerochaeta associata]UOM51031.1 TRAP transporter large permease subunit [Sphaerochaeta associata]
MDSPVVNTRNVMEQTVKRLGKITRFISFALAIILTIVVILGVVTRYISQSPFSWTEELASWLFFWIICAAIANGHLNNNHIAIDLFANKLTGIGKQIQVFIINLVIGLATLLMTSASVGFIQHIGGNSITLNLPNYIKIIPLPIFCLLSLLFILFKDMKDMKTFIPRAFAIVTSVIIWILVGFGNSIPSLGLQPSLVMMVLFFTFMLVGAPVSFSMILATFTATSSADLLPPVAVVQNMVAGGGKFILLAIPFFIIAGYLMNLGGLSSRIMDFASTLVNQFKGGLAKVNILNSLMMGGISGSSGADAASTTKVLVPEMEKKGYDRAFACAVTASSAVLPNIIPPAITMLVFASVADVSILKLFFGGIGPGILITLLMMGYVQIVAIRRGYELEKIKNTNKERFIAFLKALPSLLLFVWIIGGIRFGIVTASEAGVVGVVWALGLGIVYKAFKGKQLFEAILDSSIDAGLIGLLIAVSSPFAWVLIADHVPQQLVSWAASMELNHIGFLLVVAVSMIALGTFMDVSVSILIAAPLFLPLANILGIDMTVFGVILILAAVIGNITPPVGILVYITSSIAEIQPAKVFRECVPFILVIMIGIVLIIFNPWIITGLFTLFN